MLELQLLQPVYTDIEETLRYREAISPELAEQFSDTLRDTIRSLRQRFALEIYADGAGRVSLQPDADASTHYARPVYRHRFATLKTRRRNSAGRYNIYFTFTGGNKGRPDTLTILRVRHAGSENIFAVAPADNGN